MATTKTKSTKVVSIGKKRVRLTKKACGTVAEMRKKQDAASKRGSYARVVKNTKGSGACLWTGGKKKKTSSTTTKKRKTTAKRKTAKRKPAKRKTTRRKKASSRSTDFLAFRG